MKKLVVAALAIASSIALNAASVNWSMANGVLSPSPDGSQASGRASYYTMLIFTDSQADAVNSAIAAGNFTSLGTLALSTYQAAKAGTFGGTVNGLTGTSATLFAVVFDTYNTDEGIADAGYYYKTGTITQNTYDPTGSDPATTAVFSSTQMTGTWTAVPEPTSGLLMLLGMAGLALRRRRA
jgi:hypothetical protein